VARYDEEEMEEVKLVCGLMVMCTYPSTQIGVRDAVHVYNFKVRG
jgi:hypothetical protein